MNLFSQVFIKNLLKEQGIKPQKRFGQNFLVSEDILKKIIKAADLKPDDSVLEIGPGIGILTRELAQKAKKVIAIEKDQKMAEMLVGLLDGWNVRNVEIINEDILKIKNGLMAEWLNGYKVVANLPYYIASPVIRKFLETDNPPDSMVLMVQKEVAQRICAKPPKMNLLAVSVQFYAEPEIISFVPKDSFWPEPKVDGAIIKITPFAWAHSHFASQRRASAFRMRFFKIVKAGFSQPRKQLVNNLVKKLGKNKEEISSWLLENNIQPTQRAETLNIENWIKLTKTY